MGWLYRYEAKAIQAWILTTGRMKDLVGGSNVIEQLEPFVRERAHACGGRVHYAAAGGATLEFPETEGLERFARWWPAAVDERAPGLQVIQGWVERGTGELERLHTALTAARNRAPLSLPEAGPWIRRAPRTGLPAIEWRDKTSLDRATAAQQRAGRDGRDALLEKFSREDGAGLVPHRHLERCPRLAVVHADGNGVGRQIRNLGLKELAEFSQALSEATCEAAKQAAMEVEDDHRVAWVRPIVLGGDDLTVIVRSTDALLFVRAYLRAFEARAMGLTACAGIAIIPSGWPFAEAHALAEQLCSAAKAAVRQGDRPRSAVAFHRVKTALVGDWDQIVTNELTVAEGRRVLTDSPYPLDRLDRLIQLMRAVRKLPRGTVRQWLSLQHQSPERADRHWQRAQEVADASDWRDLVAALEEMGADPDGWRTQSGIRRTPIGDALTLEIARGAA
jgi:hypothetical protein